jgi:hypothetical protein
VIVLFLVAQVCDGLLTYAGIRHFGAAIEANPLIVSWMALLGPEPALVGAKVFASGCGIALYLVGTYRVLFGLTVFYGVAAIAPWLAVLDLL